jgi:hypothetical protein
MNRWRGDLAAVAWPFVAARALVATGYLLARIVAERIPGEPRLHVQLDQGPMAWDGAWYRSIAAHGYSGSPHEALRFFPLYPWLGRVLSVVLLGHTALALVLVANAATLVALVLVRRLVEVEQWGARTADLAVWLLCLFPASFVLSWGYSEALLLVCVAGVLLAARTGHWWWAALAGAAAALCRPTGGLVVIIIAIEVARRWSAAPPHRRVRMVIALCGPPAGLAAVLANARAVGGSWLDPLRIQEPLRGHMVEPITRLLRALGDLGGHQRLADGLHAPFAMALVFLVVVAARRLPASYSVFAGAVVALALAADNLNSLERYGLNALPLVVAAALWLRRRPRLEWPVLTVLAGGVVALSALAWIGSFVP